MTATALTSAAIMGGAAAIDAWASDRDVERVKKYYTASTFLDSSFSSINTLATGVGIRSWDEQMRTLVFGPFLAADETFRIDKAGNFRVSNMDSIDSFCAGPFEENYGPVHRACSVYDTVKSIGEEIDSGE